MHVALPPVVDVDSDENRTVMMTGGRSFTPVALRRSSFRMSFTPPAVTLVGIHPGILLISVVSGSIEWNDPRRRKHVNNAGESS